MEITVFVEIAKLSYLQAHKYIHDFVHSQRTERQNDLGLTHQVRAWAKGEILINRKPPAQPWESHQDTFSKTFRVHMPVSVVSNPMPTTDHLHLILEAPTPFL